MLQCGLQFVDLCMKLHRSLSCSASAFNKLKKIFRCFSPTSKSRILPQKNVDDENILKGECLGRAQLFLPSLSRLWYAEQTEGVLDAFSFAKAVQ